MINERFNNNYDFLRIFAASCICFTHSFNLLHKDALEPMMRLSGQLYDFSFIGLSIFFSISGYLIAKSAYTSSSLLSYFWKRFLRIQPLLILVCFLTVFVLGPIFTILPAKEYFASPETWTYFRNVFPATGIQFVLPGVFANNIHANGVNGSLWTLVVEERLYLLVSVFFFFKNQKKLFALLMLIANLVIVFKSFFFPEPIVQYLGGSHVFYALIFLNAAVLYQLSINFKLLQKQKFAWLAAVAVLILAFSFPGTYFLQALVIPFCVILIAHVRAATNKAGKWGDFTYGVYLFSFPVQQMLIAFSEMLHTPLVLFFATMAIVLPLSALSWHLLEKKCLNYKKIVA